MFTFNELCEEMVTQYGQYTRILGYVVTPPKFNDVPEKVDCFFELRKFNDDPKNNNGGSFSVDEYIVVQYQPLTLTSGYKNARRCSQHGFTQEFRSKSYTTMRSLFLKMLQTQTQSANKG